MRIEDIDASRVRPEAVQGAVDDLRWLGLDWDEGPVLQSSRLDRYAEALERLRGGERVYPCTCTRADIARAASAPHAEDEGPTYPGTCAGRRAGDIVNSRAERDFAWRFRVPPGPVGWDDLFAGPQALDPARLGGDFPVGRARSGPAYQLAVVVDDALMGVTQVVRGEDLRTSTPRQILLYRALGFETPRFGHVPLAVGEDGRRLAKRNQSLKLATLREQGADPRRLVGWLAQACGMADGWEPSRPADWIDRFDPGRLPRAPWVVRSDDLERLMSLSS